MDPAVDLVIGGLRFVPRVRPAGGCRGAAGHGFGQRAPVGPGPARHGLDGHHTDVAFGTEGEELLGRLAVLGPGPQGRVDGEHHGVEIEAPQGLEVGPGHLEVVPGDAGEAGVAGVAELEDPLERGRTAVELLQRRHGVRLVEVEDLRLQQSARRVELVGDAVGMGPEGLAGDEELVAVRTQMWANHRLGRPVLRGDVEVVHAAVQGKLQPVPRFVDAGGPTGGTAEHGHAALVSRPPEAPSLHLEPAIP